MPKSDSEFSFAFVNETTTLEQLDEIVFRKVEEHITAVSTSRCLDIKINVSFDLIKPRLTQGCFEGLWIKFPDQQPSCDTPYIVSIRDDSGDSVRHYTDVGWRSSSFLQDNAWIVDNEVNYNVEAWMFMPEPYKERND